MHNHDDFPKEKDSEQRSVAWGSLNGMFLPSPVATKKLSFKNLPASRLIFKKFDQKLAKKVLCSKYCSVCLSRDGPTEKCQNNLDLMSFFHFYGPT